MKKIRYPAEKERERERETQVAPILSPTPSSTKKLSVKEMNFTILAQEYSSMMNSNSEIFWNRKKTKTKTKTKAQANSV